MPPKGQQAAATEVKPEKRGPGRPPKSNSTPVGQTMPPKGQQAAAAEVKRGRGRPPKSSSTPTPVKSALKVKTGKNVSSHFIFDVFL
jgi:hypothetical protein